MPSVHGGDEGSPAHGVAKAGVGEGRRRMRWRWRASAGGGRGRGAGGAGGPGVELQGVGGVGGAQGMDCGQGAVEGGGKGGAGTGGRAPAGRRRWRGRRGGSGTRGGRGKRIRGRRRDSGPRGPGRRPADAGPAQVARSCRASAGARSVGGLNELVQRQPLLLAILNMVLVPGCRWKMDRDLAWAQVVPLYTHRRSTRAALSSSGTQR